MSFFNGPMWDQVVSQVDAATRPGVAEAVRTALNRSAALRQDVEEVLLGASRSIRSGAHSADVAAGIGAAVSDMALRHVDDIPPYFLPSRLSPVRPGAPDGEWSVTPIPGSTGQWLTDDVALLNFEGRWRFRFGAVDDGPWVPPDGTNDAAVFKVVGAMTWWVGVALVIAALTAITVGVPGGLLGWGVALMIAGAVIGGWGNLMDDGRQPTREELRNQRALLQQSREMVDDRTFATYGGVPSFRFDDTVVLKEIWY